MKKGGHFEAIKADGMGLNPVGGIRGLTTSVWAAPMDANKSFSYFAW